MPGRGFLDVARDVANGKTEFHYRAAVIHAYYALILECRDTLFRWKFVMPRRDNMHAWVRLRFTYATSADVKPIGDALDRLVQDRNEASYNLKSSAFATSVIAHNAIGYASAALILLDQIEADPARRTAAIASIRP